MTRAEEITPALLTDAHRFISEVWPLHGPGSEMHVGDLYWGLFHRHLRDRQYPVRLWHDADGVLQGLTVFPGPTWCDIILRPAHYASSLGEEIIAWAVRECLRKDPQPTEPLVLRIGRRVTSPGRLAFLARRGFERMSFGYLALAVNAHGERQGQQLPPGFVCRPLQQEDIPSRVAAYNLAFPGEDCPSMIIWTCGRVRDMILPRSGRRPSRRRRCLVLYPVARRSERRGAGGTGWLSSVASPTRIDAICDLQGLNRLSARAKQAIVRAHSENIGGHNCCINRAALRSLPANSGTRNGSPGWMTTAAPRRRYWQGAVH